MPIPLSTDLRWRIVWLHYFKQMSCKDIADILYIHISTVRRIIALYNQSGDVEPVQYVHGPHRLLQDTERSEIATILVANPAIYLDELQRELHLKTGTWASISIVFRTIRQMGFTRKKIRHVAMQQSEERRAEFIEEMKYIPANMIVWLDETGSDRRKERRKFGYHLRGMTPVCFTHTVCGKRLNSIAIMSARGLQDFNIYEGNIDGETFYDFVQRCLLPILKPFNGTNSQSVVVMDNASIHRINKVVGAIQESGALLRFQPPYSPDLNPIEEVFSKVKYFLRENEVVYDITSSPRLIISMAFNSITTEDCTGYITHAQYNF